MFKLTGFDELQKELQTASRALKALDGTVAELKFDPSDPQSVNAAIKDMERAIDRKVAPYRNNEIVRNLALEMKASYKSEIRAQHGKRAERHSCQPLRWLPSIFRFPVHLVSITLS